MFNFTTTMKAVSEEDEFIVIEGMASTDDKDKSGDVIPALAWSEGLSGFRKNPVILFNHSYNEPVGKAVEVSIVPNGLKIVAHIYKSSSKVYTLIKNGVLQAFSVGFMVKDADYDSMTDIFVIKAAELLEVSVVAVPANGEALFSMKKSFDNNDEYLSFIKSVTPNTGDTSLGGQAAKIQEKKMDPIEIQKIVEETAKQVAAAFEANRVAAEAIAVQKAAEEAKIKADAARTEEVIRISVESGTKRLMDDVTAALAKKDADMSATIEKFAADLAEKSDEIAKMRSAGGKHSFSDRGTNMQEFLKSNEDAIVEAKILGTILKKGWDTKLGNALIQKVNTAGGVVVPSGSNADFESIVSTAIERDMELALIIAPLFRTLALGAASLVVPTIPDAGYAQFAAPPGSSGTGSAYKGNLEARADTVGSPYGGIQMGSKVLTTSRLISKSYITNEVEEDAIIPVLPLIREAMIRSHARSVEHSLLLGNPTSPGTSYDLINSPYAGMFTLAVSDSKSIDLGASPTTGNVVTAANLLNLRQLMGKYGIRARDVAFIVSMDAYYDLLDDTEFQNLQEVGVLATKLTGEVGNIFNSPVLVSDEFPTKANGAPFAIAINTRNFVIPTLRGLTVESEYDVEEQRTVLVATQRRGFDRLFSAAGQVVGHTW